MITLVEPMAVPGDLHPPNARRDGAEEQPARAATSNNWWRAFRELSNFTESSPDLSPLPLYTREQASSSSSATAVSGRPRMPAFALPPSASDMEFLSTPEGAHTSQTPMPLSDTDVVRQLRMQLHSERDRSEMLERHVSRLEQMMEEFQRERNEARSELQTFKRRRRA